MKEDLENKIMKEIKGGRAKLKSKYVFLAEKLGLGSGLVLTILLGVLLFSLILYYAKETDNLIYLSFGPNGFLAFMESFPYLFVVFFIIIILLAGFLIKKTDFSYKKSFGVWSVCLIVFIILMGTVLTFTNINKRFDDHMFAQPFFEQRNGIAGKVIQINNDILVLNTKKGIEYINIENINVPLKENDFIIMIGERRQDSFFAKDVKIIEDPQKMPLVRKKLGPPPNKECVDNCLKNNSMRNCMDLCK